MDVAKTRRRVEQSEAQLRTLSEAIADELRRPPEARAVDHLEHLISEVAKPRAVIRRHLRDHARSMRSGEKARETDPRRRRQAEKDAQFLKEAEYRLRLSRACIDLIREQVSGSEEALFRPPSYADPHVRHQATVMEQMHKAFHRLANPNLQHEDAATKEYFKDIPLPAVDFLEAIHAAYRVALVMGAKRPLRFLDIGCGGGTKSFMAAGYFDQADGLEYDANYAEAGQRTIDLLGATRCRIYRGDALEFGDYNAYDVLYMYRPISNYAAMTRLEQKVIDDARPGTVVVAPYIQFASKVQRPDYVTVRKWIQVVKPGDLSDIEILARAERTGLQIVPPSLEPEQRVGYWLPVIEASAANGFVSNRVGYRRGALTKDTLELPQFGSGFTAFV